MISKLRKRFQHRYNSFFGLLGVAIPTLIVVISYRLLLDGLGEVGFGVYLLAASIGSVMAFMDLGISSANIKFIAEDKESAILKISKQYGFVSNARAIPIVGKKLNSIIINGD